MDQEVAFGSTIVAATLVRALLLAIPPGPPVFTTVSTLEFLMVTEELWVL